MEHKTVEQKDIELASITAYDTSGNDNVRDAFESDNFVLFKSQLKHDDSGNVSPEEKRIPIMETFLDPSVSKEDRQKAYDLLCETEEPLMSMAESMSSELGQVYAIQVRAGTDGNYSLMDGTRRTVAKIISHYENPKRSATIRADIVTSKVNSNIFAVMVNAQRKDMNPVELARAIVDLKKRDGLTDQEVAEKLCIYGKKKGGGKQPNRQIVRNLSLLMNPKVTDAQRKGIEEGRLAYSKVLRSAGLIKEGKDYKKNNEEAFKRNTSISYKNLKEVVDNRGVLEKILKKVGENPEPIEVLRLGILYCMQEKYKPYKEPVVTEGEEAPAKAPRKTAKKKTAKKKAPAEAVA